MRILFFIETGGPGGAEQVVLQLARGFQEKGYSVAVCTLRSGWLSEQLVHFQIEHILLESSSRFDVSLPLRLAKELGRFDVLHTHLFDSAVYGAIASKIAGKPHLASEHGDVHHINTRRFSTLKFWILRLCRTRFTAVSHFTREALIARGIAASRISVLGNPLRAEQFERLAGPADVLEQIPPQSFVWVHLANLRKVKDQETLLRGFAAARKNSSREQVLLIVGDGPERAHLEEVCKELGVSDAVRFLGFRNDVRAILSIAQAKVLSSHSEALPMSLLEAGALGCVLISSDVGGVRDIIAPGRTGLLFEKGDAQALGLAMQNVVSQPSKAQAYGVNVREAVKSRFLLDSVLTSLEELYFPARQKSLR